MNDKPEFELEEELQLISVEPQKNRLDELTEQLIRLNAKCDIIIEKIKARKKVSNG